MRSITARRDYRGSDDGSEIFIAAGTTAEVTDEKADQLERDFGDAFVIDASKAEREQIEAEYGATPAEPEITNAGIDVAALLAEFDGLDGREALSRIEELTGDEAKALLRESARQAAYEDEGSADDEPDPGSADDEPDPGSADDEPDDGEEEPVDEGKSQAAAAKRRAADKKKASRRRGKRTTTSRTRRTTEK